jgi:hypothetical protein
MSLVFQTELVPYCPAVFMLTTVFTRVIFALLSQFYRRKTGVRKLWEEFLEGDVLEVTFRLGPESGTLFINLKWNVSEL